MSLVPPLAACVVLAAIVVVEIFGGADGAPGTIRAASTEPLGGSPAKSDVPVQERIDIALARPLFSIDRRPAAKNPVTLPGGSDLSNARLTGIVTVPGRRVAIFDVAGAKPLELSEGETVDGWRIDSIGPQQVSVSGPGGATTLLPRTDASLAPAAGSGSGRSSRRQAALPLPLSLPAVAPPPSTAQRPGAAILPRGPGRTSP